MKNMMVTLGCIALLVIGAQNPAWASMICPTEDSVNCVWIGPLQGNGRGCIVFNGVDDWTTICWEKL